MRGSNPCLRLLATTTQPSLPVEAEEASEDWHLFLLVAGRGVSETPLLAFISQLSLPLQMLLFVQLIWVTQCVVLFPCAPHQRFLLLFQCPEYAARRELDELLREDACLSSKPSTPGAPLGAVGRWAIVMARLCLPHSATEQAPVCPVCVCTCVPAVGACLWKISRWTGVSGVSIPAHRFPCGILESLSILPSWPCSVLFKCVKIAVDSSSHNSSQPCVV